MITVTVKKTFVGHFLFLVSQLIIRFRLLRTEKRTVKVLNKLLCNDKVFKLKIDTREWQALDISDYSFGVDDE